MNKGLPCPPGQERAPGNSLSNANASLDDLGVSDEEYKIRKAINLHDKRDG